jgi:hypothetical protein
MLTVRLQPIKTLVKLSIASHHTAERPAGGRLTAQRLELVARLMKPS